MNQNISKSFSKTGLESAPPMILQNVMSTINPTEEKAFQYVPLISKRAWIIIVISITILTIASFVFPVITDSFVTDWKFFNWSLLNKYLSDISLTTSLIYTTGLGLIFLFQLLFIKKTIDKYYSF